MPTLMSSFSSEFSDVLSNPLLASVAEYLSVRQSYADFKDFLKTDSVKEFQAFLASQEGEVTARQAHIDLYFDVKTGIQFGLRITPSTCQFLIAYSEFYPDEHDDMPTSSDPAIQRLSLRNYQLLEQSGLTIGKVHDVIKRYRDSGGSFRGDSLV